MTLIIKILGGVFIGIGLLCLIKPVMFSHVLGFFKRGGRIYAVGVLRLVLATMFLLAARECEHTRIIAAIGILLLISGLLIFVLGEKRLQRMIEFILIRADVFLRIAGVMAIVLGGLIIYAA